MTEFANGETDRDPSKRLMNGVMGLNGEAGEVIDIVKKHIFQGHNMDREDVALELGDTLWYLTVCADALGYTLEDIMEMNIAKLKRRYPNGFSSKDSKARVDEEKNQMTYKDFLNGILNLMDTNSMYPGADLSSNRDGDCQNTDPRKSVYIRFR